MNELIIELSLEENWKKEWNKIEKKFVKRPMTFEEAIDFICENCQNDYIEVEVEIDEERIEVCKECAKQITNDKLNDPEFYRNIKITII